MNEENKMMGNIIKIMTNKKIGMSLFFKKERPVWKDNYPNSVVRIRTLRHKGYKKEKGKCIWNEMLKEHDRCKDWNGMGSWQEDSEVA